MRYIALAALLFFTGCSTKVFEPENTQSKTLKSKKHSTFLSDYTKNTLTFADLRLKKVKKSSPFDDGLKVVKVYFDKNGNRLGPFKKIAADIAVNADKMLIISQKKVYTLPFLIYSATQNKNLIAVVFENGKYGVYDTNTQKMKFVYDSDEVLSVRYARANPLFYKDLILFPLLSGNVAVVDAVNGEYIRTLNISNSQFNDNVIFLKIVNGRLFMATQSKLILFDPKFLMDYSADIKHIVVLKDFIYLFTTDGEIIKLDSGLKELKKVKLKYASFSAPSVCRGNIYTVEKEGYLIEITPDLNVTVYDTKGDFSTGYDSMLKIRGCRIYNDYKVFMIE